MSELEIALWNRFIR